jgi:hypothetical protein
MTSARSMPIPAGTCEFKEQLYNWRAFRQRVGKSCFGAGLSNRMMKLEMFAREADVAVDGRHGDIPLPRILAHRHETGVAQQEPCPSCRSKDLSQD